MKHKESIAELHKITLVELQKLTKVTEHARDSLKLKLTFGQSSESAELYKTRKALARQLTIARERLSRESDKEQA